MKKTGFTARLFCIISAASFLRHFRCLLLFFRRLRSFFPLLFPRLQPCDDKVLIDHVEDRHHRDGQKDADDAEHPAPNDDADEDQQA